jgi:hypothetical protein
MNHTRMLQLVAVGGTCAALGAAGGIAGSFANSSHHGGGQGFGFRGPIHSEAVVANQDGSGFNTITTDAGTVKSVNGNQLTITEGTDKAVYKEPTLTIPDGSKVFRNGQAAGLGDLKAGDRVKVLSSAKGTFVIAKDPAVMNQRHRGFGRR